MAEKVHVVGVKATRIRNTGPTQPRLDPAKVAAALGGEPLRVSLGNDQGPLSLGALGSVLLERLRSTGGRPALVGATQKAKVPLSEGDVERLEKVAQVVGSVLGFRPSIGQVASVILSTYLTSLMRSTHELRDLKSQELSDLAACVGRETAGCAEEHGGQ
jgi:hypothetical protein